MYPLLLKPIVKEYIWGGTRLKTEFGLACDSEIAAEAWMLSCHKDGANTVRNGEHKGKTLPEVLELWGAPAKGKNATKFQDFPLLIKLIDAKQNLSVQVHPDNDYALKNEGECGKTEMWYVIDCEEGAELIYGFKKAIDKEEFRKRIENNTLMEVCNKVPVKPGDVFFIAAGTLHAIGGGILIAEVQQNSNSTYRVYDYGRVGSDGKPRQLHIEKAMDVTKCEKPTLPYGQVRSVVKTGENTVKPLAECEFFSAALLSLKEDFAFRFTDSFVSLLCLKGHAVIHRNGENLEIAKGDSVFIPAGLAVNISGDAEILYSYV